MLRSAAPAQPIPLTRLKTDPATAASKVTVASMSCCLQGGCLPCALNGWYLGPCDNLVTTQHRIARGASVYRSGDALEFLYAVRSGAFKTVRLSRRGEEKVTGFHLAGEMLGLEAISAGHFDYDAVALEHSEVCTIPFAALEKLSLAVPALQRQLLRILSSDISRDQGLMLLMGNMSAEQRLAAFLLSLSRRYQTLGFAADRFILRMTREEIGSYLGLTLETISRLLSRFQREGLIGVHQREIELRNEGSLRELVGHW